MAPGVKVSHGDRSEPAEVAAWVWNGSAGALPDPRRVGGKAWNLARMESAGRVPTWIALTTDAHAALATQLAAGEAGEAAARDALLAVLRPALRAAGLADGLLAVRSSAAAEDGAAASFAGQFATVLGVDARSDEALWRAVRAVWASAESERVRAYAAGQGAAPATLAMGLVLQAMLDPEAAGVAFSADPVTGDAAVAVVSAVPGLGEALVSGDVDADTFRVRFTDEGVQVAATLAHKGHALHLAPNGGTRRIAVEDALRDAPCLSEMEAVRIARAARELAERLGAPQDVEWALLAEGAERALVLLQTRPITTLGAPAATAGPVGERRIWDNSNIVESYGGVTTPLTFSFARGVYAEVYREFCRFMGVAEPLLEAHTEVFANMLGLLRGRVYYNLLNWYRTLALLPGFTVNRAFMERMMGVRESLAGELPPGPGALGRRADLLRLLRMPLRMLRTHAGLARAIPAFHVRVDAALAPLEREDLVRRSPDELLSLYRRLERELLAHWRTPLVNDFFAMIWFGVLGRLVARWLPEAPLTLMNDLLAGQGGIISAEPAERVRALAALVRADPALERAFRDEMDDARLLARIRTEGGFAGFLAALGAYLERFGDRCMNELKLETVTLREDPTFLLRMVRAYAAGGTGVGAAGRELAMRQAAEHELRSGLGRLRRRLFGAVLSRARLRVRDRENLRFERTRVFGVVRRIFLALGAHLADRGAIEEARDVFFLTREELFAHLEGTSTTSDLKALIRLRRAEFEQYRAEPPLPERFETVGPPRVDAGRAEPAAAASSATAGSVLSGTGCCPGVVRARVRIVRDPREAGDLTSRILVAERTDPGWTLLFPLAAGLLVERGSLLSHSAIVAREVGLPCVVGIAGLLATLREGEVVEMNGASGSIRRLEEEAGDV